MMSPTPTEETPQRPFISALIRGLGDHPAAGPVTSPGPQLAAYTSVKNEVEGVNQR